jgi:nucleoside-diphosphate-sugar epimerase
MGKVLVTGATGFIGGQLAEALLARGDDVTCLVRHAVAGERLKSLGARVVEGSVTAPDGLSAVVTQADTVFHLAGAIRAINREDFHRVNAGGVAHLLDACRARATPPTVVIVSSLAAVGPSTNGRPRKEDDPPHPVSNYGRSKLAGEIEAAARAGQVPITIARPPIVLGEGDRVGLAMFRMIARFRTHLVPGLVRSMLSVVHVADLVAALIAAADRGTRLPAPDGDSNGAAMGERVDSRGYYFIAGDEDPTYGRLGRMVGEAIGRRRMLVIPVPSGLVWPIAACVEATGRVRRRAPFAGIDKAREALAGHWTCSPARARVELGFAPAASLPERLRQTAEWYRRKGWL